MSENLKPFNKENAAIMGTKGGKASQEARRKNKKLKKCLTIILDLEPNEEGKQVLQELGIEDDEMTNQMYLAVSIFNKAIQGDVKAAEFIRDTTGQKPVSKLDMAKTRVLNAQAEYYKNRGGASCELTKLDLLLSSVDGIAQNEN